MAAGSAVLSTNGPALSLSLSPPPIPHWCAWISSHASNQSLISGSATGRSCNSTAFWPFPGEGRGQTGRDESAGSSRATREFSQAGTCDKESVPEEGNRPSVTPGPPIKVTRWLGGTQGGDLARESVPAVSWPCTIVLGVATRSQGPSGAPGRRVRPCRPWNPGILGLTKEGLLLGWGHSWGPVTRVLWGPKFQTWGTRRILHPDVRGWAIYPERAPRLAQRAPVFNCK